MEVPMSDLDQSDLKLETFPTEPENPDLLVNEKQAYQMEEVGETIDEDPEPETDYALPMNSTKDSFEEVPEMVDEPEISADVTARTDDFEEVEEAIDEYPEPEADYAFPLEPAKEEFEEVSEAVDEPELGADATARTDDFEEVEETYEEPEVF
jgi:hypothetical protein